MHVRLCVMPCASQFDWLYICLFALTFLLVCRYVCVFFWLVLLMLLLLAVLVLCGYGS